MKQVVLDGQHDTRHLRNALGRFPTGVTVVTTRTPAGKPEGLTANSFAALSLEPPLVLWSVGRNSPSAAGFVASGRFAVNVLRAEQTDVSHRFATRREHKFDGAALVDGLGGCPLLEGALATFEGTIETVTEGGDHLLFIGRVHRIGYGEGEPLIFSAGRYCTARPLPAGSAAADLREVWGDAG